VRRHDVAVGKFSQVRKGTTVLTRNNIFAFSASSPYTISTWNPNVNGQVDTIAFADGDCSAAYIGGSFTSVGGTAVKNTAKVSTSTGAPIAGYLNSSPARVTRIEEVSGHLLVGGYFAG
jgi:hypothetical protein